MRLTNRSPDLYKTPHREATTDEEKDEELPKVGFHSYPQSEGDDTKLEDEKMKEIIHICDSENAIKIGSPYPEYSEMNWPWENRGQLLVISVPYREGKHRAEKVSHFLPVLKHLTHLHSHGRVHGDIRAFNIVFVSDKKGWLIDLDFGGVNGKAKYPENFNFSLEDGKRFGTGGETINKIHDYYALWEVFVSVHDPDESATEQLEEEEAKDFLHAKASIGSILKKICNDEDKYDSLFEKLEKGLEAIFTKYDFNLNLDPPFKRLLKEHAVDDEVVNVAGVQHGSPRHLAKTKRKIATGSRWGEQK